MTCINDVVASKTLEARGRIPNIRAPLSQFLFSSFKVSGLRNPMRTSKPIKDDRRTHNEYIGRNDKQAEGIVREPTVRH